LSSMNGMQVPNYIDSGRCFFTVGSILYLTVNIDVTGAVAYAAPDLNNTTDPNSDVYFDWYEFAIVPATWVAGSPTGFWGNCTQVDQFCFPIKAAVYSTSGLVGENGITASRSSIWSSYKSFVPSEFQGLANTYRINAPTKDMAHGFGIGAPYANYMNSYLTQMWALYRTKALTFTCDWGANSGKTVTGNVVGDSFVFNIGGAAAGSIQPLSTINSAYTFACYGPLATGNDDLGAIEGRIAAALNRHVMEDSSKWGTASAFYKAAPCNYYSAFWHTIAVGGGAYGFPYDDVGNFSGSLYTYSGRGVMFDIGW
jgi:beta-galactosidase